MGQDANEANREETLFPKEKFIELDLIAADSQTLAFLDAITMDQEIMEQIIKNSQTPAQYKEGQIIIPPNNEI